MAAGPPGADYRISPQTARRCVGIRSQVVNGSGKGEKKLVRYVPGRRTKVNRGCSVERHPTVIKTRPIWQPGIKSSRSLFMGWTVTGSSAARAWHRLSCGTWEPGAPMPRERPKGEAPVRVRVPMRSAGADRLVVVSKPGNAGGAKGPNRPASGMDQPARGGMLA